MDLLSEYKELYYKEIEHSERLNGKLSTCITFLSIIGGAIVLVWTQLKNFDFSWYTVFYVVECCISTVLFVVCLFKFIKTYTGYKMHYFPIRDMAVVIQKTYVDNDTQPYADEEIENIIAAQMAQRFVNDAIHNRKINVEKNRRHRNLIKWISISFLAIFITYSTNVVIDFYESKNAVESPLRIILVSEEVNYMCDDEIEVVMKNVKTDGTPINMQPTPTPEILTESFGLTDVKVPEEKDD